MSRGVAYVLVISFLLLTALGFVMLLSTSPYSQEGQLDSFTGVRRQGLWLLLGLVAAGLLSATDYHRLEAAVSPLFWAAIVLLALCFINGIGVKVGGASRWISLRIPGLGAFTGQPSELAKLTTVIALAAWCARYRERREEFFFGFALPLLVVALPVALIAVEVDLGTASLIFLVSTAMLYIAGTRTVYILGLILIGAGLLAVVRYVPQICILLAPPAWTIIVLGVTTQCGHKIKQAGWKLYLSENRCCTHAHIADDARLPSLPPLKFFCKG